MLKTGINLSPFGFEAGITARLDALKSAGFDAFFTGSMDRRDMEKTADEAAKRGLVWDSVHAPFKGMNSVWIDGEEGESWVPKLREEADKCRDYGIGYFTVHCRNVPRFNPRDPGLTDWSDTGADRFLRIAEYCVKVGVRASFENVEFPQYELARLLSFLRRECPEGIGFTWDMGHEHCYPGGISVSAEFGDLLTGTHIHDNKGNTDPAVITWDDDSHLLPFDGNVNFEFAASELKRLGYKGVLMLELKRDVGFGNYADYTSLADWLAEARRRLEPIVRMCDADRIV